jgi:hypothetical protein
MPHPYSHPTFPKEVTTSTMQSGLLKNLQKSKWGLAYNAICAAIGFDITSLRKLGLRA